MTTRQRTKIDLEVSKKLKERRQALGLTQEQLASALGVTFQQIQKYERGANRISSSSLYALAKVLNTDISYFFEEDYNVYKREHSPLFSLAEDQAAYDIISEDDKNQLQELVYNFIRIKDPKLKQSVINLAKSLRSVYTKET